MSPKIKGDNVDTKNLFVGPRLRLSAPLSEDAAVMASWTEDSHYLRMVDTDIARPQSAQALAEVPSGFEFRLRLVDDNRLIGFVALMGIEWANRIGKMAIGIGDPESRGVGYGYEASALLLNYGFGELNLHRVGLDVIAYNKPAIGLYQKLGFQLEGRDREAVCRDGVRYDLLRMGLLASEWRIG